ncbi:MAG: hypothetical protein QNK26_08570, partial [Moritella sp.]|uniref:hypothetical protein n=1 Tax=Moritella sp. TaxID=78556 RepID=UPI0029A8E628
PPTNNESLNRKIQAFFVPEIQRCKKQSVGSGSSVGQTLYKKTSGQSAECRGLWFIESRSLSLRQQTTKA